MSPNDATADFVRRLAAGVLDPSGAGADAIAAALAGALEERPSLVLEVRFTGFALKDAPVGGVDPSLLRAAGQLIMHRVARVGFTGEAGADDLAALLRAAGASPAALAGEGGIVGALQAAGPRGVYLATSGGEAYRPPRAAAPPAGETAGEGTPAPGTGVDAPEEEVALAEFELLSEFPELSADAEAETTTTEEVPAKKPEPGPPGAPAGEGGGGMYAFFRAKERGGRDAGADELPELLRAAAALPAYDELTQAAADAVPRLLEEGRTPEAVAIVDALGGEAERADRTRIFRDSALAALRRLASRETLTRLAELLRGSPEDREPVLRLVRLLGASAAETLEDVLLRTPDAELRAALFRSLVRVDGVEERLLERAMQDAASPRARAVLDLAVPPDLPAEAATRWAARAAAHPATEVREDAAHHLGRIGGPGALRLLVELLGDREERVRRAAVEGLGGLRSAAAVPFLTRALGDADGEEMQVALVEALGATGSPEALPPLRAVIGRRQLFGGRRLARVKEEAVAAIAAISSPSATAALSEIAEGRDESLAALARQHLARRTP